MGAGDTADAVLSTGTGGRAQAAGIEEISINGARCEHTQDSGKGLVPAIKGGRRLQAAQPDDPAVSPLTNAELDEVFVLIHPLYEKDWFV